jgi:hypothetical protein
VVRDNQVEMTKERNAELKLIEELCEEFITAPNGKVRNKCGQRFRRVEEFKQAVYGEVNGAVNGEVNGELNGEVYGEGENVIHEGGASGAESGIGVGDIQYEENLDIPDEDVHAASIKDFSINDTDDMDVEPFIDTKVYLSDFSTLMLNAIIYRLNKLLGFETMLLISHKGDNLYLLIKASEGDLRVHAQKQKYLLSLEVGYTDLVTQPPFSLGKLLFIKFYRTM